jgi:hypothetical protein
VFDFNTSASDSASSDLIQQSLNAYNAYKREKNKNELDKNE